MGATRGRDALSLSFAATLVGGQSAGAPGDPRRAASQILSERRFRAAPLPHPLRQPLHDLGKGIENAFNGISVHLPGGRVTAWVLLIGVVALIVAAVALRVTARRRARAQPGAPGRGTPAVREDPRRLERLAEEAERRGDFSQAVVLRFRAGLLRLDRGRAIALRPSTTSGEVARQLHLAAFADIATQFDQVAYGRRSADAAAANRSRRGWEQVLATIEAQ